MATTITIDPVTRIEGHLEIEVTVDDVGGEQQVVDAKSAGTMFRGFEMILIGRDPRDAAQYTQRICGVCPVSHAMASCMNLDNAFGVTPPDNGRILRNLVLGANYIQSHLLHFYHLSAVDFIDTTGLLDMSPWTPRYVTTDMATGTVAEDLVNHYLTALAMRRKAHQMGAIFGGKLPCTGSFVVGGITENVTAENVADFRTLLTELRAFIDDVYIPDVTAVAGLFPSYYSLGVGYGNLLSFGVFDQDAGGTTKLFDAGRYTDGSPGSLDPAEITEYVTHAWYTPACDDKNPADGVTEPDATKPGAYSWLKAPRYLDKPHELGPLARMWINGDYTNGISVLDRIMARALEAKKIADEMDTWLDDLVPGDPVYQASSIPQTATGMGLTEAPRGALGHWMSIDNSVISRYQVITPTNWNASPKDHLNQVGPIESAMVGTPVPDAAQPVEVLRVVHSFDPCLACAVHLVRPNDRREGTRILIPPGIA
ncbi:MAG: nickel-dependent hydrogenase large subunit [Phycisphaerales bacterium]|nr:MAG: nickel-dependent hydrogenase large subunit [Phycisphaerales bacterium]